MLPVPKLRVSELIKACCIFEFGHVMFATVAEWKFGFSQNAENCDVAGIYWSWFHRSLMDVP